MTQSLKELGISIAEVKKIFFESMLAGYVNEEKVETQQITELPGYKCFEFIKGDFRVLDAFCVRSGSDVSHGFTTIWNKDVPLWVMNYGGQYPDECIYFLKYVLALSYNAHQFEGGRGPRYHNSVCNDASHNIVMTDYFYMNNVVQGSDFTKFSGKEHIEIDTTSGISIIGQHNYFGGLI